MGNWQIKLLFVGIAVFCALLLKAFGLWFVMAVPFIIALYIGIVKSMQSKKPKD